jgi:hypothetical protein
MTLDSFVEFCQRHPFLLYPVIIFQTELRTLLNDTKYWDEQTAYRFELSSHKYIAFDSFLKDLLDGVLQEQRKNFFKSKGRSQILIQTTNQMKERNRRLQEEDSDSDDELPPLSNHHRSSHPRSSKKSTAVSPSEPKKQTENSKLPITNEEKVSEKESQKEISFAKIISSLIPFLSKTSSSTPAVSVSSSSSSPAASSSSLPVSHSTSRPSDIIRERKRRQSSSSVNGMRSDKEKANPRNSRTMKVEQHGVEYDAEEELKNHMMTRRSSKKKQKK